MIALLVFSVATHRARRRRHVPKSRFRQSQRCRPLTLHLGQHRRQHARQPRRERHHSLPHPDLARDLDLSLRSLLLALREEPESALKNKELLTLMFF